jgi:hypothetical protein
MYTDFIASKQPFMNQINALLKKLVPMESCTEEVLLQSKEHFVSIDRHRDRHWDLY